MTSCFESALWWPFRLRVSNPHFSDLFVFVLRLCTLVTFSSSCFKSALWWPFFLRASNVFAGNFLSSCFESPLWWPFRIPVLNLHFGDISFFLLRMWTLVTFSFSYVESALWCNYRLVITNSISKVLHVLKGKVTQISRLRIDVEHFFRDAVGVWLPQRVSWTWH